MKLTGLVALFIGFLTLNCAGEDEELFFSHLSGWVRNEADSMGVNDLFLQIMDIDPDNLSQLRERTTTTMTEDSFDGYFEMDSVLYGTSELQGSGYVRIVADTAHNDDWPYHIWFPNISGEVAAVTLYISKDTSFMSQSYRQK